MYPVYSRKFFRHGATNADEAEVAEDEQVLKRGRKASGRDLGLERTPDSLFAASTTPRGSDESGGWAATTIARTLSRSRRSTTKACRRANTDGVQHLSFIAYMK